MDILKALDILVSVLLVTTILLQMQGKGLSSSYSGGGEFYRSRRSVEKLLFRLTIILAFSFAIISIVLLIPR